MKMKKIAAFIILPLVLTSCSKGFIRYGVNPYINVERADVGQIKNTLPSSIKQKMDNKDSFVLLLHYESCEACKIAKENYIYPFLDEHNIIIYGIDVYAIYDQDEKDLYQEISEPFNNKIDGNAYIPHLSIFHEGNYVQGELSMEFFTLLIESYVIL